MHVFHIRILYSHGGVSRIPLPVWIVTEMDCLSHLVNFHRRLLLCSRFSIRNPNVVTERSVYVIIIGLLGSCSKYTPKAQSIRNWETSRYTMSNRSYSLLCEGSQVWALKSTLAGGVDPTMPRSRRPTPATDTTDFQTKRCVGVAYRPARIEGRSSGLGILEAVHNLRIGF